MRATNASVLLLRFAGRGSGAAAPSTKRAFCCCYVGVGVGASGPARRKSDLLLAPSLRFRRASDPPLFLPTSVGGRRRSRRSMANAQQSGGVAHGGGDGEIIWCDVLSTLPILSAGDSAYGRGGEISFLSWNILSQTSEQVNEPYSYRGIDLIPPRPWEHRLPQILRVVRDANADVVCLQEVSSDTFRADLLPSLREDGYDGMIQKGKGRFPAVATLWKSDRLDLEASSHRSRTMTVVLRDSSARQLAVVNCHLEGHPHKSHERVTQMHHALRDASAKHSHHGLVAVGDFNCELHSSFVSAYLALGSIPVESGVLEWGRPPPAEVSEIPPHAYNLTSAYPPELTRDHPFEYFTYCRLPGRPGSGLDHAWYTEGPLRRAALRRLFPSEEDRRTALGGGLPSDAWPSDHVPIGFVLRWDTKDHLEDLQVQQANTGGGDNRTRADLLMEASELLAACPFENEEERREFNYTVSNVPGLPERRKPTPDQIAQLEDRRERRERLLGQVSDEARQILRRVMKLRRDAAKLKQ